MTDGKYLENLESKIKKAVIRTKKHRSRPDSHSILNNINKEGIVTTPEELKETCKTWWIRDYWKILNHLKQ